MKSQDQIEDSTKIPEGRKINRDFHFLRLFSLKIVKDSPCDCNLFYRVESGSKHERKSYFNFSSASTLIKGYDINKYET